MSWLSDFRRDVHRYTIVGGGSAWKCVFMEQGLWALLQYRMESAVYHSSLPGAVRVPLRAALTIWHKLIEIMTGISLPCTARIGAGLHLPHCGLRIINGSAIIGEDCCISHGVTIGVSGRGEHRGVPVIGDRVYLGVNAVIVGKIFVGDDCVIGASSLVNRDVPAHCTVVGVPSAIISAKGSEDYIPVRKISDPKKPNEPVLDARAPMCADASTK